RRSRVGILHRSDEVVLHDVDVRIVAAKHLLERRRDVEELDARAAVLEVRVLVREDEMRAEQIREAELRANALAVAATEVLERARDERRRVVDEAVLLVEESRDAEV